jgi:hypothetical protein
MFTCVIEPDEKRPMAYGNERSPLAMPNAHTLSHLLLCSALFWRVWVLGPLMSKVDLFERFGGPMTILNALNFESTGLDRVHRGSTRILFGHLGKKKKGKRASSMP